MTLVLFFEILFDLGLIDTVPPIKPQPIYETAEVQAFWDVPVYERFQELRANRIGIMLGIVNTQHKQVIALEMSFPWVSNHDKKTTDHEVRGSQIGDEAKAPRI